MVELVVPGEVVGVDDWVVDIAGVGLIVNAGVAGGGASVWVAAGGTTGGGRVTTAGGDEVAPPVGGGGVTTGVATDGCTAGGELADTSSASVDKLDAEASATLFVIDGAAADRADGSWGTRERSVSCADTWPYDSTKRQMPNAAGVARNGGNTLQFTLLFLIY